MDGGNIRRQFRAVCKAAGIGEKWTPRELRHTFVSLMSDSDVAVEEIARFVGHASSTETVYRHQLRRVITKGAEMLDGLLGARVSGQGRRRSSDLTVRNGLPPASLHPIGRLLGRADRS